MKTTQGVVPLEELGLFQKMATQNSVDRDLKSVVRPTAVVSFSHPLKFVFRTSDDEYLKWNRTELVLKVRIMLYAIDSNKVRVDTKMAMWKKLGVANNLMHSLIDNYSLAINGQQVSKNEQNYPWLAYLQTLLGFGNEAKEKYLSSVMWSQNITNGDNVDETLLEKVRPITDKNYIDLELRGKLFTDLTYQPRALLGGNDYSLEIFWKTVAFIFHSVEDNLIAGIDVKDAYLETHCAKVTPAIVASHKKALQSHPAIYPIVHSEVRMFTINANQQDAYIDNAVTGNMPRRLILGLVNNKAVMGDVKHNPYCFHHYDLSHLCVYINGVPHPVKPITPNFESGQVCEAWYGLVEAMNQDMPNSTFPIDRYDYVKGNTLYGINFAPDLSDGAPGYGHVNDKVQGNMRIELKFRKPLPEVVSLVLYTEDDNNIMIDKNRCITTDFHI